MKSIEMLKKGAILELAFFPGNCRCFSFFSVAVRGSGAMRYRRDD